MQLFPGYESDFFRNRMTHSLEVAQIAKSIAQRINCSVPFFSKSGNAIDTDLIECAALAHDLGHPPFGHTGEEALHKLMRDVGGFEGNAQTLRILAKLEKKDLPPDCMVKGVPVIPPVIKGVDRRIGLNLTYRTLASVLKYDFRIPVAAPRKVTKGYYGTEATLVKDIKKHVLGADYASVLANRRFQTIECQIMEYADDVAYATYDLEDTFKAGFLTPLDLLTADEGVLEAVAAAIRKDAVEKSDGRLPDRARKFMAVDVYELLAFRSKFGEVFANLRLTTDEERNLPPDALATKHAIRGYQTSTRFANDGYYRTLLTSTLIKHFIRPLNVTVDRRAPVLSKLVVDSEIRLELEVLKKITYTLVTMSPRLRMVQYRGGEIVTEIFNALARRGGDVLLPNDFRKLHVAFKDEDFRMRVICDFVAGMSDRYAVEFYGRLKSESPESIFKPF